MRQRLIVLTGFCALAVVWAFLCSASSTKTKLAIGAIRNGELYWLEPGEETMSAPWALDSNFDFVGQDTVWVALLGKVRLSSEAPDKNTIQRVSYGTEAYPAASCRLHARFGHGHYWGNRGPEPYWGTLWVSLKELDQRFEPDVAGKPAWQVGQWPTWKNTRDQTVFRSFYTVLEAHWEERAKVDPKIAEYILRLKGDAGTASQPFPLPPGAYFDFLPIGESRLLFFLMWQNQIRAWQEEVSDDPDARQPYFIEETPYSTFEERKKQWSKNPTYTIPFEGAEPFVVYGTPPHFLFATESGKLYGWHGAGQPSQKVQKHWESAPPIRALITDYDTGKTWAFAKPDRGTPKAAPVYCLLDPETGIKNNAWKHFDFAEVNGEWLPAAVTKLLPYIKVLQDNGDIPLPKK